MKTASAALAAAVLGAVVTVAALKGGNLASHREGCARQPADGGVCLHIKGDGATTRFGSHTFFPANSATGECEFVACPASP